MARVPPGARAFDDYGPTLLSDSPSAALPRSSPRGGGRSADPPASPYPTGISSPRGAVLRRRQTEGGADEVLPAARRQPKRRGRALAGEDRVRRALLLEVRHLVAALGRREPAVLERRPAARVLERRPDHVLQPRLP